MNLKQTPREPVLIIFRLLVLKILIKFFSKNSL
jgi:hypothetical protein